MLLGPDGMRALLMEVAHPLIAAGVADHSDFRKRPFKRLYRTMRPMRSIRFGSRKAARGAVERIGQCHSSVQGELRQPAGCHPSGHACKATQAADYCTFAAYLQTMLSGGTLVVSQSE